MLKQVYLFEEGNKELKSLLGSKGANLAEMCNIGLPVPPGFTLTTNACIDYLNLGGLISHELKAQVHEALKTLEVQAGKRFGDPQSPLLISVRSGAQISMPGMMETILNLGLNDATVEGLIQQTRNPRFVYDSYRRLMSMVGTVVFGLNHDLFEQKIQQQKDKAGVKSDTELKADDWQTIIQAFKSIFSQDLGREFPQEPDEQLWLAVEAVFRSWNTPRAVTYRKYNKIPHDLGTAVNIQAMVFGNLGNDSGTGVTFTRNPSTGEKEIFGEFLINAQGEDVVAGTRTPLKIEALKKEMPQVYNQLAEVSQKLEHHYHEMQDIEFTIEKGKLYLLQTRTGKRTAQASVKIAVDFVYEGILSPEDALLQVNADQLSQILLPTFDPKTKELHQADFFAKGLGASPGAATGRVVFSPDEAEILGQRGEKVILVRSETVPDDIHGIIMATGVLTTRGGSTSHAAVVTRGMGKPCITGCESLRLNLSEEIMTCGGKVVQKGDTISIDGSTGEVFIGELPTILPNITNEFETLLHWSDQFRTLEVRANADTPTDAQKARSLGAKGIGLCRTEHMFMDQDRLPIMQQMILSESRSERYNYLQQLMPMQYEDFKAIFKAMEGYPVTIRLLDPPLHEFLPNHETLIHEINDLKHQGDLKSKSKLDEKEHLLKKVQQLKESNPMLGFRGCRLGLLYPEIFEMQTQAIIKAAIDCMRDGIPAQPEIMIPLVGTFEELKRLRERLTALASTMMSQHRMRFSYPFGTMIEVPRAALTAEKIAPYADFFSFGTNDLTQMTFGYSRDDAEGRFLSEYLEQGILPDNPFETIDRDGVGQLILMTKEKARMHHPQFKLGICGEHGGDARSVAFCHEAGLNYVSCSPFRVPVARVAGAQAAIQSAKQEAVLSTEETLDLIIDLAT